MLHQNLAVILRQLCYGKISFIGPWLHPGPDLIDKSSDWLKLVM